MQALEPTGDHPESQLPSPLLITLSEQLSAKITAKLLSASDVLALATFVRSPRLSASQQLLPREGAASLHGQDRRHTRARKAIPRISGCHYRHS